MSDRPKKVRAWQLWANPILQRYCRSRLRFKTLAPALLATLIFTTFLFFLFYVVVSKEFLSKGLRNRLRAEVLEKVLEQNPDWKAYDKRTREEVHERVKVRWGETAPPSGEELKKFGARTTLLPLLAIQGIILMFIGTGTVASGITQEGLEGMIEYQRLTPMTPAAKIVGYLFGLPIREYVLSLVTLPFFAFAMIAGQVPARPLGLFYLVFFTSVMLYHLTGLLAGFVVKRRWMARGAAQMLVILLYILLPQFSAFGLVIFPFLTVSPSMVEHMGQLIKGTPFEFMLLLQAKGNGQGMVPWFRWEFTPTQFSLLIQLGLCLVFFVMLARRWRDPECHLLGKPFAVATFGAVMLLLMGNLLAIIPKGGVSMVSNLGVPRSRGVNLTQVDALLVITLFGCALLCFALAWISIITPTREQAVRGLRRAKKLGQSRVPMIADEASSIVPAWIIAALAAAAWCLHANAMFSHAHSALPKGWPWYLAASILLPAGCFHAIMESRGRRALFIILLLLWLVPVLASIVLMAMREHLSHFAAYLASLSGFTLPFFATESVAGLSSPFLPKDVTPALAEADKTISNAYYFSLLFYLIATPFLLHGWWRWRRNLVREVHAGQQKEAEAVESANGLVESSG